MYEALVARVRYHIQKANFMGLKEHESTLLLEEAADAIEELSKRVPVPPHGRLIDADEFLKRAFGTKCFRGDYALMLEELVGESSTIIEAEGGE